jgi:hypothetical protein
MENIFKKLGGLFHTIIPERWDYSGVILSGEVIFILMLPGGPAALL